MKVRMRVQITGTRNGVAWPAPGETMDLPDDEGARMCRRGFCTPDVSSEEERAVVPDVAEKRAAKRPAKRAAPKRR